MANVIEKVMDFMKLNDDDFYDDEDDFEYDEAPLKKKKVTKEDYDDEYEDEKPAPKSKAAKSQNKVIPIRSASRSMEVCVIKPANVEDAREIADTLLSGRTVVLNLEGLHVEMAQRIIDFTSGSCYSINGNLQKVSNYIFLITPENVDISGDFQDIVGNGFDVSTLGTGL